MKWKFLWKLSEDSGDSPFATFFPQKLTWIMCVCVFACSVCPTLSKSMDYIPPNIGISAGFSRQKRWSGLPCLFPGDLPEPGMEPTPLMAPALAGLSLPQVPPGKPLFTITQVQVISSVFLLKIWGHFSLFQFPFFFFNLTKHISCEKWHSKQKKNHKAKVNGSLSLTCPHHFILKFKVFSKLSCHPLESDSITT